MAIIINAIIGQWQQVKTHIICISKHNNHLHPDSKERHSSFLAAMLFTAADASVMSLIVNLRNWLIPTNSGATLPLISLMMVPASTYGLDDNLSKLSYLDLLPMLVELGQRFPGPELPKQYEKYTVGSITSDGSVVVEGRTFKIAGILCDEASQKYLQEYLLNPNTSVVYLEADKNGKGEIFLWNIYDSSDKDKSYNKAIDGITYMSMTDMLMIDNVCEPGKDKTFTYYYRYKHLYDLREFLNSKK
jgi:hypothetical protein